MPFRRALSLRPVISQKHEITWSNLGQDASSTIEIVLIHAQESPIAAQEIDIASIVKSIFLETNLNGVDNSGTVQVFHWYVMKVPAGLGTSIPSSYNSDSKKFILHRGMEMLPQIPLGSGGTVQTKRVFVVKIPPRLRRFDDGDKLVLRYISTSSSQINYCGISIFKEFK